MNWFAATIMVIWLSSALGAATTKDSDCFLVAMVTTIAMGIGYLCF